MPAWHWCAARCTYLTQCASTLAVELVLAHSCLVCSFVSQYGLPMKDLIKRMRLGSVGLSNRWVRVDPAATFTAADGHGGNAAAVVVIMGVVVMVPPLDGSRHWTGCTCIPVFNVQ